eukprot:667485-Pyramimonas_sp.AAC.1
MRQGSAEAHRRDSGRSHDDREKPAAGGEALLCFMMAIAHPQNIYDNRNEYADDSAECKNDT